MSGNKEIERAKKRDKAWIFSIGKKEEELKLCFSVGSEEEAGGGYLREKCEQVGLENISDFLVAALQLFNICQEISICKKSIQV